MKGFTLIELLAVIIILAIVALIATPIILNVIEDSRNSANMSQAEILYSGAQTLYASGILNDSLSDKFDGEEELYSLLETTNEKPEYGTLKIDSSGKIMFATYIDGKCYSSVEGESTLKVEEMENPLDCAPKSQYKDLILNGNDPVINNGLIPVLISNDGTITLVDNTTEWYNYANKQWANAVILQETSTKTIGDTIQLNSEGTYDDVKAIYVWIPRFEYQIFDTDTSASDTPETINIEFVNKETEKKQQVILGENYTHPAFTFGSEELSGFWVGKFELTGNTTNTTILPGMKSLTGYNLKTLFTSTTNIINNLEPKTYDSHLIKNIEWGAITYLTHSKYGINSEVWINNNSEYITGCGSNNASENSTTQCTNKYGTTSTYNQTTTGNIYGIFDMNGGLLEYVMGSMNNSSNNFYSNSSGFTQLDSKYYDSYSYGTSYTDYTRAIYGDATRETTQYYSDKAFFPNLTNSWMVRGGYFTHHSEAGIFYFSRRTGAAYDNTITSRAVLTN